MISKLVSYSFVTLYIICGCFPTMAEVGYMCIEVYVSVWHEMPAGLEDFPLGAQY